MMNAEALKHTAKVTPCQAIFYTWEELSNLYTALLSGYFERKISANVATDSLDDSWYIQLWDKPLFLNELHALLDTVNADDYDREANEFEECPIERLSQSVGNKIIALQSPFPIDASHAADDGVYFTGNAYVSDLQKALTEMMAAFDTTIKLKDEPSVTITLPNNQVLRATTSHDAEYPSIRIELESPAARMHPEPICFVEHNPNRPNGHELCICTYTAKSDEPDYYESYHPCADEQGEKEKEL